MARSALAPLFSLFILAGCGPGMDAPTDSTTQALATTGPAYGACPLGFWVHPDGFKGLRVNENMGRGTCISNRSDLLYFFALQTDGNLVLYDNHSKVLWTAGVAGRGGEVLTMQNDGNLVLRDARGRAVWATGTQYSAGIAISYFQFQTDGNAVVYRTTIPGYETRAVWATHTAGQ